MSSKAITAPSPMLCFLFDLETGGYFIDMEKLCVVVGLDPRKVKLKLLAWDVAAKREGLGSGKSTDTLSLPLEMVPEFLESVKEEAEMAGCLQQVVFNQLLFTGLQARSKSPARSTWTAAKIAPIVQFVSQILAHGVPGAKPAQS